MQCNLLQLLFQAMYRSVVSLVIRLFHILHNVACPVAADPRDVTPLIRCIIKDRVFHAASCLANSEGKRATDSNFADQFVLDSLKAGRMVPDLAIADSDFTIWIWTPNNYLVVLIDNDDERASNIDTLNTYVVLKFDFARAFELSKNTGAPHIHDSLFSDGSACMPSWNLFEFVWSAVLTHLVLGKSGVDSHWTELVLIRIISNLSEIVRSTGPKFPSITLLWVICQEKSVVLAAGDLIDRHAC